MKISYLAFTFLCECSLLASIWGMRVSKGLAVIETMTVRLQNQGDELVGETEGHDNARREEASPRE